MATIALIWELGADLGHISRYMVLGKALKEAGHRPILILRDIARAEELLGPAGLEYLQAPLWLTSVVGLPPAINFTETLFQFGFLRSDGLLSIAKAWRKLWSLINPDLMVFDQAPTALLASRGLTVPRLITGNSFAIPPHVAPWPVYRFWEKNNWALRQTNSEDKLLSISNQVLDQLKAPRIASASELFEADITLLAGTAELDVYGARNDVEYVGAINSVATGAKPNWPLGQGKKIFAYLKPIYPEFEAAMQCLKNSGERVIVFAPGIAKATQQKFESALLAISTTPYCMEEAVAQCDFGICHSGGTADVLLDGGKPVIMLPMQMEQSMTSKRIEDLGFGLSMDMGKGARELERKIKQLIRSESIFTAARQYAAYREKQSLSQGIGIFVERCETLLKPKRI